MSKVKSMLKSVLGAGAVKTLKNLRSNVWYAKSVVTGYNEKCVKNDSIIKQMKVFSIEDRHVFFGYYDIPQVNKDKTKMLVDTVAVNANEGQDSARIEIIDINTGKFRILTETNAWCWQQGSRLRWHPTQNDCIVFNNSDGSTYSCEIWNISDAKKVKEIPYALYDVDSKFEHGITLNFTRLQYFRPGYGYSNVKDASLNDKIPQNDGVFLVDLNSGAGRLLISLEQLASTVPNAEKYYHYINHLSFSKSGKRFMFFHVWTSGVGMDWKLRLYVANADGSDLRYIETDETYSHYSWKDDTELLLAAMGEGNTYVYSIYNADTNSCKHIKSEHLKKDGHPSWVMGTDCFVTDISDLTRTKNCMQSLYTIRRDGNGYKELLSIYSCPTLTGDRRCDLHPRVTPDGQMISMDSTCYAKRRSAILIDLNEAIR